MDVCDVCNVPIDSGQGFLLTTSQVVTVSSYWEHLFKNQLSELRQMELMITVAQQEAG
jgi:hypothetical protein